MVVFSHLKLFSMKKNLLFSLAFISISFFTLAQKSNMIFFTQNEEKFYLVINGVQQNTKPLSNVKVSGMAAPMQYKVRIKFAKDNTTIDDKVTIEPNMERTWSIQPKNNSYIIRFLGETDLLNDIAEKKEQPEQEEIIYRPQTTTTANDEGFSVNMNTGEESANISMNAGGMNATIKTSGSNSNSSSTSSSNEGSYQTRNSSGCRNTINMLDFRNELKRVSSQTAVAGKKIVAEKIAKAYCLSSIQVNNLCNALVMTSDKMDIAKYCYTHCSDPENYEEVYKCFPLSSSVRELDEYINSLGMPTIKTTTHHPPVIYEEEYVPG